MGKPNQTEQGVLKSKTKQRGGLPRVSKSDTSHQTINAHDGEKKEVTAGPSERRYAKGDGGGKRKRQRSKRNTTI